MGNRGFKTFCIHKDNVKPSAPAFQAELMVEIYFKSLVRAFGKVLLVELSYKNNQNP